MLQANLPFFRTISKNSLRDKSVDGITEAVCKEMRSKGA